MQAIVECRLEPVKSYRRAEAETALRKAMFAYMADPTIEKWREVEFAAGVYACNHQQKGANK